MTTLRIKEFADKKQRLEYYAINMAKLDEAFPDWYVFSKAKAANFKQKIIFGLLKYKMFKLVDRAYRSW